jgi:cysteine-rich repeat protein
MSNDTPTPTPTAPMCGTPAATPVCGNGAIEEGETCDDCNTVDGDNCPADCVIRDCLLTATTFNAAVSVQTPGGGIPGALDVIVGYPDGVVGLPGHGADANLLVTDIPGDAFSTSINDLDYALIVVALGPDGLTLGTEPAGLFFTARFSACDGENAPSSNDFHCTVRNATAVDGTDITTSTTCSVSLP